jgi:two-component system chemotaxis response regulator CheB
MGYELIVAGTSWGGLRALEVILRGLPHDFDIPIAIVQHRRADSDDTLVALLRRYTTLPVCEAEDKQPIVRGNVYIAPPDYHLLVDGSCFALSTDQPVLYSRPSIDVLFESASDAYRDHLIGLILTGSNQDGAYGLSRIKEGGGLTIVQDPTSAESPAMPQEAIARVRVDKVLPLAEIGPYLGELEGRHVTGSADAWSKPGGHVERADRE